MANLSCSIKIAVDFVSTWSISRVQALEEGQRQHRLHTRTSEDLLQLYHMLWYTFISLSNPQFRILPSARPAPSHAPSPSSQTSTNTQSGLGAHRLKNRDKRDRRPYIRPTGEQYVQCPVELCVSKRWFQRQAVVQHA